MSLFSDVSRYKVSDNFPSLRPLRNGSKATKICNKLARNFQKICARGCNPLMKMTYIHFNVSSVNGGKREFRLVLGRLDTCIEAFATRYIRYKFITTFSCDLSSIHKANRDLKGDFVC